MAEADADQGHASDRLGCDRLSEERSPEEERADRQKEGHEKEVGGSRDREISSLFRRLSACQLLLVVLDPIVSMIAGLRKAKDCPA